MNAVAGAPSRTSRIAARWQVIVLLLFGVLWFGNLEYRDLVDPDEGRYAEVPREMMVSGDWVTPRLNDLKYFEKPALQYWITASLYKVFGVDEWVARLWPALAGLLCLGLTFVAARRLEGARIGIAAALVLAGMLHFVVFAHVLTLDMTVTLFLSTTIFATALAQHDQATPSGRMRWMLLAWAAMAGAVLSKGLIGIVLPGATIVGYAIIARDGTLLRRLHAGPGLVLFLVLAVPWFAAVSARNPDFARFFFWHEHVERFLLPEHHRPGPWWYFIAVGAAGTIPWVGTLFTPRTALLWQRDAAKRFQPTRFLLGWCVLVTVFFSASSSKLPGYILPIFPALAVLIAIQTHHTSPRALARSLAALVPLLALAAWWLPEARLLKHQPAFQLYFGAFLPWVEAACGVLAIGLACAAAVAWRGRLLAAIGITSASSLVAISLAMTGHQAMSPLYSTEQSFDTLASMLPKEALQAPFYSVRAFDHSLLFELERPVTLVDYRGELAFGLDAEPAKGIPTLAAFRDVWLASNDAFAVMRSDTYDVLARDGLPMTVVLRDPIRVFVRRR